MSMDVHSEIEDKLIQKRPRTSGRFLYPLRLATEDLFSLNFRLYEGVSNHVCETVVPHGRHLN